MVYYLDCENSTRRREPIDPALLETLRARAAQAAIPLQKFTRKARKESKRGGAP